MAITQAQKDKVAELLDSLNLGTKKAEVGQTIIALIEEASAVTQGAAVPDAAGATPTKAEFDALLASLRGSGAIAAS
ncbi:hypothetical protein D3C76_400060 [compost metagenome]